MTTRRATLVALAWLLSVSCGVATAGTPAADSPGSRAIGVEFTAPNERAHPLAGRIWSAREGRLVDEAHVLQSILVSDVILFGETHDNTDHRLIHARLLEFALAARPRKPALVIEQAKSDQQAAIDGVLARPAAERTVEALLAALDWDKGGWGSYDYKPLFGAVLASGLALRAGDAPRAAIRKAAKEGLSALDEGERRRLGLETPLGAAADDAMLDEIEASHCGLMPKSALGGMAQAQRYRDAALADATLAALGAHGSAVVVAGNGHVRTDRAVPWYLRQRAGETKIVAIAIVEVEAGKTDPASYVPKDPAGAAAIDYIVFTPRAERPDPCEEMRKSFGKQR